jgi:hypothetical protein
LHVLAYLYHIEFSYARTGFLVVGLGRFGIAGGSASFIPAGLGFPCLGIVGYSHMGFNRRLARNTTWDRGISTSLERLISAISMNSNSACLFCRAQNGALRRPDSCGGWVPQAADDFQGDDL